MISTDLKVAPDGGILMSGAKGIFEWEGYSNFAAIKLTPDGLLDSTFAEAGIFEFDSLVGEYSFTTSINLLPSGNIILGGESEGKITILILNSSGELLPNYGVNGVNYMTFSSDSEGNADMELTEDGKLLSLGYIRDTIGNFVGRSSFLVTKIIIPGLSFVEESNYKPIQIFPNPNQGQLFANLKDEHISEFRLFNAQGQLVQHVAHVESSAPIRIDLPKNLPPGVYRAVYYGEKSVFSANVIFAGNH